MNKELNYFAFIVVLSFGYFIGLFFPDIDQGMQGLLGHRSIITHSILLPYLLYSYFKKKNNLTPLKTIFIVGIYLGIGLHLSADLHPKAFRGFALIKLPFNIDIGELSPIWIGINAGVALFLASTFLNQLTNKKLFWITYLLIALFVGLTYADEEPYNNDAIIGTFIFLLFVTFIYTKIKYRKLTFKEEAKNLKKPEKKKKKNGKSTGIIIFMVVATLFGGLIYLVNNTETFYKKNTQKKEQIKNWRADSIYKDEFNICKYNITKKYPKKSFSNFAAGTFNASKNQKTYTKTIKMFMKHDGLILKNKKFGYVDCYIKVNTDQTISFIRLGNKYK